MKIRINNSTLIVVLAAWSGILFTGCATTDTHSNTKSLLASAGFRVRTPQNAKQHAIYNALPSYKIERATVKGNVFYVFKDEQAGVAYVGREAEHQRYQQLCAKQHAA